MILVVIDKQGKAYRFEKKKQKNNIVLNYKTNYVSHDSETICRQLPHYAILKSLLPDEEVEFMPVFKSNTCTSCNCMKRVLGYMEWDAKLV